jgi:hypothetical protein
VWSGAPEQNLRHGEMVKKNPQKPSIAEAVTAKVLQDLDIESISATIAPQLVDRIATLVVETLAVDAIAEGVAKALQNQIQEEAMEHIVGEVAAKL